MEIKSKFKLGEFVKFKPEMTDGYPGRGWLIIRVSIYNDLDGGIGVVYGLRCENAHQNNVSENMFEKVKKK